MQGSFEKTVLEPDFPFRLFFNNAYYPGAYHWHEDIEIIYLMEGKLISGINGANWELREGDILLIGPGEMHCFYKGNEFSNRAVIQFRSAIYDGFLSGTKDAKVINLTFSQSRHLTRGSQLHTLLEVQIKQIINEHCEAKDGYKLILKARLYDIAGILLRHVKKQEYSTQDLSYEKDRLKKIETVLQYVETNFQNHITLEEISKAAGFSKFYFTRFFKENTGMTFVDYMNNFKVLKAEWHIINESESITAIAYKSGFNSIKTFNRVFKNITGYSPKEFKRFNIYRIR